MKLFVVTAHHNTGHGEIGTPVLITEDVVAAVDAARNAEKKLGYQFYAETFVSVCLMEVGRAYSKADHKGTNGPDADPSVYVRRFYSKKWTEEWHSPLLQRLYMQRKQAEVGVAVSPVPGAGCGGH